MIPPYTVEMGDGSIERTISYLQGDLTAWVAILNGSGKSFKVTGGDKEEIDARVRASLSHPPIPFL